VEYNQRKVDDAALALLYLTSFTDHGVTRAWRNIAWEVTDRLYEKGLIHDPKGKAKSIVFTEEGEKKCESLFNELFSK